MFVVVGLQPYTWYDMVVQPFHRDVDGPSSTVVRERTDEDGTRVSLSVSVSLSLSLSGYTVLHVQGRNPHKRTSWKLVGNPGCELVAN